MMNYVRSRSTFILPNLRIVIITIIICTNIKSVNIKMKNILY